jgi:hypothetical protein
MSELRILLNYITSSEMQDVKNYPCYKKLVDKAYELLKQENDRYKIK